MSRVTRILNEAIAGDPRASAELLPLVYEELRNLAASKMRRESEGHTFSATALVHEAYIRLIGHEMPQQWSGRNHFFGAAAEAMRRILVDYARRKQAIRRGGHFHRQPLADDEAGRFESADEILFLNDALAGLDTADAVAGQVVRLRYFAGLTMSEIAETLSMSERSVYDTWSFARAWLHRRLADDPHS